MLVRLAIALGSLVVLIGAALALGSAVGKESPAAGDCERFLREPTRHRSGSPPRGLAEARLRRRCSLDLREVNLRTPRTFDFDLIEAEQLQMQGIVDSNSPAVWADDSLMLFNSAWGETYRSSGDSVANLAEPQLISLPELARPGQVWIEALWNDPNTQVLYGWYHFEPADFICLTAPIIGAAVSYDRGLTWEDRGFVIESPYGIDCDYDNGYFVGGSGDFSVVQGRNGRFFYFLFTNYAGPLAEQGIAVARGQIEDRGQPGSVMKYYQGSWSQPGVGGRATALFPSSTGWKGPYVESFWGPSVHWNTYLDSYVALLNHTAGAGWEQEGIYISFSQNLITWTEPVKILESNDWYPQVLGLGPGETDSLAGRSMRVYVAGVSDFILEFRQQAASAPAGAVLDGQ